MALRLRSIPLLVLVLCGSAGVTVACGDDADADDGHSQDEPQVCKDISSVCHDLDTGSGTAHDCHEQAHDGDAAVCEMIRDECLAFCAGGTETGSTSSPTSESDSGSTHGEESTGDDGSTGHDSSTAAAESGSTGDDHSTGTETGDAVCPLLGSGCHDVATVEGQECHDIGHDGDEVACAAALVECTEICGL